jgi:hypothetical protein
MFDVGGAAAALTLAQKTPNLLPAESFHHYEDSAAYGTGEKRRMESPKTAANSRAPAHGILPLFKNGAIRATRDLLSMHPLAPVRVPAGRACGSVGTDPAGSD